MANQTATDTSSKQPTVNRKSKNLTILWELMAFIRPYRWQVSAALLALVFTASLTLSVGHGVRLLIDQGFAQQSLVELRNAVQFLLLIVVLIAIGTFFRFYLVSSVGERVSADIRQAVFDHVIGLHPSYFETHGSGEIMSRITTDTSLLQNIIGSSFSMAMRSALLCLGAIIMLFATNIKLTLIVLASVPFILVPILIYGRRVRALSRQSQDSMADVGSYAGEAIANIKTVQSFAVEDHAKAAFGQEVERAYQIGRERVKQRAILISGVIVIVFSAITGMLWVGGRDVIHGAMSAGDLGAFVFFAIMVASSMATLSEVLGELQRAAGATERLVELLHVQSHIRTPATSPSINAQSLSNDIRFEAIHFHYPTRPHQAAINALNLAIQPGEVVALVGPSGAGKTTVFELLQRFYDPQSGAIMLGGQDIRTLSPQGLRQQMALVPQQPALFSDNVIGNIRYGKPDASEQAVKEAAIQAHADEFIQQLPEGYHSFLGERGVRLSGGQRQRIAIARAILKDPRILLLDEATSALDSESEHAVQQGLAALMRDRTTLIIAHRLSTIQHADRIVVMDKGQCVDVGTHRELLTRCPLYQRLVKRQFNEPVNP